MLGGRATPLVSGADPTLARHQGSNGGHVGDQHQGAVCQLDFGLIAADLLDDHWGCSLWYELIVAGQGVRSRGCVPPYFLARLGVLKISSSSRITTTAFQNPSAVIPNHPSTRTSNHDLKATKARFAARAPKAAPAISAIVSSLLLVIGVAPFAC